MPSLGDTILFIVERRPGISDDDLAEAIHGERKQQLVNGECNYLVRCGKLERRQNGPRIGNFLAARTAPSN